MHIYEIGDHGSIIVIAKKNVATREIEFSWDEGESWDKLTLSDKDLYIRNIIIEPSSLSTQFIVYGTYTQN